MIPLVNYDLMQLKKTTANWITPLIRISHEIHLQKQCQTHEVAPHDAQDLSSKIIVMGKKMNINHLHIF